MEPSGMLNSIIPSTNDSEIPESRTGDFKCPPIRKKSRANQKHANLSVISESHRRMLGLR